MSYQTRGGSIMVHPAAEAPLRAHIFRLFGANPGNAALQLFTTFFRPKSPFFISY